MGYGYPVSPRGRSYAPRTHVHEYAAETSFSEGHAHGLSGTTSPTINPGPYHVHILEGSTTFNDGHTHYYKATTGPAIQTGPGSHIHRYSGIVEVAGSIPHTHRFYGVTSEAPDDF